MKEALEITATDTTNEEITGQATTEVTGTFPGVAVFYHSDKQRDEKYGSRDIVNKVFGFDPYIPRLYGVHEKVRAKYVKSNKIITGYTANTPDSNTPVDIYVYPQSHERVYRIPAVLEDVKKGKEKNYYCPWLNPTIGVNEEIELYGLILFPKSDELGEQDEFIQYKKSQATDNTIEEIYFKLVKVSSQWEPLEYESDKYYLSSQAISLSATEQEKVDQYEQKTEDKETLITEIQTLENTISSQYQKVDDLYYTKIPAKRNDRTAKYDVYKEAVDIHNEKLTPATQDAVNRAKAPYDTLKAEVETLEKELADLKASLAENEKTLREKKTELTTLQRDLEEVQHIMSRQESRNSDNGLSVTVDGGDPFKFEFQNANNNSKRRFKIKIKRVQASNKNAALIAFYKREDKEYIIGQVNILATDYHRKLTFEDKRPEDDEQSVEMLYNPMPIHFVNVKVRKYSLNNKGVLVPGNIESHSTPNNGRIERIVNKINDYFRQSGLSFRLTGSSYTPTDLVVDIHPSRASTNLYLNNHETLWVNGKGFKMDGTNIVSSIYKQTIGGSDYSGDLLKELKALFARHIMNNILYDTTGLEDNQPIVPWDCCHLSENANKKIIPLGEKYKGFIRNFESLFPKPNPLTMKYSLENAEKIWKYARHISKHIVRNTSLVFMFDYIEGEKSPQNSLNTAGYAIVGYNGIVMYGNGCSKWEDTLPHELGHTLSLQHTFHQDCPMVPEKVPFNDPDWATNRARIIDEDLQAFGASFYNIMDYENQHNTNFKRSLFTKYQWEEMIKEVKRKSYLATVSSGVEGFDGIAESNFKEMSRKMLEILE